MSQFNINTYLKVDAKERQGFVGCRTQPDVANVVGDEEERRGERERQVRIVYIYS